MTVPPPASILPLTQAWSAACCQVEARAYNALRRQWGQPEKEERKPEFLSCYIGQYPAGARMVLAGERLVGFCISQRWGTLGWIGTIAVDLDWQGRAIGHALIESAVQALQADGCTTIALETWPHIAANIQFYLRLGFRPLMPVFILEKQAAAAPSELAGHLLSRLPERRGGLDGLRDLSHSVCTGLDYTPAAEVTLDCGLGETILWGDEHAPWAAALVYTASQLLGTPPAWLEVFLLTLRPGAESRLARCLAELEAMATRLGRRSIRLAVYASHSDELLALVGAGEYRIVKSRLRWVLRHQPVDPISVGYVSFGI